MKNLMLLLAIVLGMVACTPTTTVPTPTSEVVEPIASATSLPETTNTAEPVATTAPSTVEPTASVGATNTPAPLPPTFTVSPTEEAAEPADVTPTPVVDPAIIPPAPIIIAEPGNGSKVTSPITVRGVSDPAFEQNVVARLISADGTEIAVQPGIISADLGQRGDYEITLDFEVSEITPAFIQVYIDNPMDGGITKLASVGIQLLPASEAAQEEIIENSDTLSHIVITSHADGDVVSGGTITIEGFGRPTFESTFVVEMTDESANLLAREAVTVNAPMGQYGYFSVTFPYTVAQESSARIAVRDISPAHGDNAFVNSVFIRLNP